MKKLAFALLGAGIVFSSVQADNNKKEKEQKELSAEEQADENAKASFSGVYLGGGVHFVGYQSEADYLYGTERTSREDDNSKTRLGGTIVLGVGKKIHQCFLAAECGTDAGQNTVSRQADKVDQQLGTQYSTTVTRKGLSPWFGIRAAWASERLASLLYLKIAGNFAKDEYKHSEYWGTIAKSEGLLKDKDGGAIDADFVLDQKVESISKTSKIRPEIDLGLEKRWEGLGLRAELGYVIGGGSKDSAAGVPTAPAKIEGLDNYSQANTQKALNEYMSADKVRIKPKGGFVLRLMAVKNFNLFR